MNLRVKHGWVALPGGDPEQTFAQLRAGTFEGTVAGRRVIGVAGIAALTGMQPRSVQAAQRRLQARGSVRRPLDLPEPLCRVEWRGSPYLYDLDEVRAWAVRTGKLASGSVPSLDTR